MLCVRSEFLGPTAERFSLNKTSPPPHNNQLSTLGVLFNKTLLTSGVSIAFEIPICLELVSALPSRFMTLSQSVGSPSFLG